MNKFMRIIALVCVAGTAMPAFCPPPKLDTKRGNGNQTLTQMIYPDPNAQPQQVFQGPGYQLGDTTTAKLQADLQAKEAEKARLEAENAALKRRLEEKEKLTDNPSKNPKPVASAENIKAFSYNVFSPYVETLSAFCGWVKKWPQAAYDAFQHSPNVAFPTLAGFLAYKWYTTKTPAKSVTSHFVEAARGVLNATKEVLTSVKHPNVYMPLGVAAAICVPLMWRNYGARVKQMFASGDNQSKATAQTTTTTTATN